MKLLIILRLFYKYNFFATAHPKTKVFLTHCGLHGVMEGIYFGIPMVGMPIFIDQGDVLIKMKEKGIARGFNKDNTTADEIYEHLHEVLYNSTYKENVMKLSHLMRDVRETPLEKVMLFLEYLIRHNGAEHLKLSSRHLNFLQYFSIDTLSFIFLVSCLSFYIIYKIMKLVFKEILRLRIVHNIFNILVADSYIETTTTTSSLAPQNPSTVFRESGKIERSITSELSLYGTDTASLLYGAEKKRI